MSCNFAMRDDFGFRVTRAGHSRKAKSRPGTRRAISPQKICCSPAEIGYSSGLLGWAGTLSAGTFRWEPSP
jgi:hypothetical protein